MMPPKWRRTFMLWAKTEEYKNRILEAEGDIHKALDKFDRPFVSFSGGKDSTVMLHLVLQQAPDILVFHWDYGPYYMPRGMEAAFLAAAKKMGASNIRVETSSLYEKRGQEAVNVLGRVLIGHWMPKLKADGYDACFVGLRAEESCKRKVKTQNLWEYHGEHVGPAEVFPIRSLTWLDVWAYITSGNLPYPAFYDQYAKLLGYDKTRLVTFFDMEFEKFGSPYVDGFLSPEKRYAGKKDKKKQD